MKRSMQLDPHYTTSNPRRWLKRATNRQERRAAKRDPENAPQRRSYHGYWS